MKNSNKFSESDGEFSDKSVAVIVGYYQGERFIKDQLGSIFSQNHPNLNVFLSDDSSKVPFDPHLYSLEPIELDRLHITRRPMNVGYAKNFLEALVSLPDEYDYYAFSDQDDIWHDVKLTKAIEQLDRVPPKMPALYGGRIYVVDSKGLKSMGLSPLFKKPFSFQNALIQSYAGGNTMVLNKHAKDLISKAGVTMPVVSHDWWCYQLVSGAGGKIIYDPNPYMRYRQHTNNIVGANNNWRARYIRIKGLLAGNFRDWNNINFTALKQNESLLTEDSRKVLDKVIEARRSNLFKRLLLFKRSKIYRQTLMGNLGLILAMILNKV